MVCNERSIHNHFYPLAARDPYTRSSGWIKAHTAKSREDESQ